MRIAREDCTLLTGRVAISGQLSTALMRGHQRRPHQELGISEMGPSSQANPPRVGEIRLPEAEILPDEKTA
jgi:hypothetical protein